MKSFKFCINKCKQPVQKPSKILCKECLEKLSKKKIQNLNLLFDKMEKVNGRRND
jgi:hypothetical protein